MRKVKIVATLGPASNTPEMVGALVRAGVDVFRLNFSHGSHEDHARVIRTVREVAGQERRHVAILQDLPGPKIRTGKLRGGKPVQLRSGEKLVLTDKEMLGTAAKVSVSYPKLARDVVKGGRILLSDGLIELRVDSRSADEVVCSIINGGELGERKGVNLPGARLRISAMTDVDENHIRFGLDQQVDYIAVSFVRSAKDVQAVKDVIRRAGCETPVISKIEKPEAVDNLSEILSITDGVMVARGDLGVEMPPEKVPVVQKAIIDAARLAKLPVITATQMLESMTVNPRPTRAEASDVANAIFDGTDAIMLSGETASGKYPVEAVQMMVRIASEAERHMQQMGWLRRPSGKESTIAEVVSESAAQATSELDVRAVVVFTRSGSTARLISKYRPIPTIHAFCHEEKVCQRVGLYWGVLPQFMPLVGDTDSTVASAERILVEQKLVQTGDIICVVAGSPFGTPGGTNTMKMVRVGES